MGKARVLFHLHGGLYKLRAGDLDDIVPQTFGSGAGFTTLGSNAEFGTNILGMSTTTGWDLTTGFSTPKAFEFVPDLAGVAPGRGSSAGIP